MVVGVGVTAESSEATAVVSADARPRVRADARDGNETASHAHTSLP